MDETPETILAMYCKPSDFNAETQQCSVPFYGPAQTGLPPLGVADSLVIAAGIGTLWAIGFKIRMARRIPSY